MADDIETPHIVTCYLTNGLRKLTFATSLDEVSWLSLTIPKQLLT